jgi:hypothetical protein
MMRQPRELVAPPEEPTSKVMKGSMIEQLSSSADKIAPSEGSPRNHFQDDKLHRKSLENELLKRVSMKNNEGSHLSSVQSHPIPQKNSNFENDKLAIRKQSQPGYRDRQSHYEEHFRQRLNSNSMFDDLTGNLEPSEAEDGYNRPAKRQKKGGQGDFNFQNFMKEMMFEFFS